MLVRYFVLIQWSAMAVVVRVKRSLDEEPLEALVLSCKRRKTNAEFDDSVTAVFKFAGTVARQDENVSENLSKLLDKQGVKDAGKSAIDVLKKSRLQSKTQSENSRYKLVNYFRALDESALSTECEGEDKGREFTVLDVEAKPANDASEASSSKSNGKEIAENDKGNFVYDLYHKEPDNDIVDIDDLILDGIVSVSPLDVELVHDSYRGYRAQDAESDSEDNFEDEDSNDENNWRNDYPDEDDLKSDDDDLAIDMGRVTIGNEELSSDDDGLQVYDGKLSTDEVLFGSGYAKYKKRICEEFGDEEDEDSSNSLRSNSSNEVSGCEQTD